MISPSWTVKSILAHDRLSVPNELQIILKASELCNIDCTYCYYYKLGSQSYLKKPKKFDLAALASIHEWINMGAKEVELQRVRFCFHGGEPLLLPKREFANICRSIISEIEEVVPVRFYVQTNGTLIDSEWIKLFEEFKVDVGVSLDGDKEANDRYRLDKLGKSTFDKAVRGLKELLNASETGKLNNPGVIVVVNKDIDLVASYRFLRSLGIKRLSFLFPDDSSVEENYSDVLLGVFREYLKEDDISVRIRNFDDVLVGFQQGQRPPSCRNNIFVVRSDGRFAITDSYMPVKELFDSIGEFDPTKVSLKDAIESEVFDFVERAHSNLHVTCKSCKWVGVCRGGDLEDRYRTSGDFCWPSRHCDTLYDLYEGMSKMLSDCGYPAETLSLRQNELNSFFIESIEKKKSIYL